MTFSKFSSVILCLKSSSTIPQCEKNLSEAQAVIYLTNAYLYFKYINKVNINIWDSVYLTNGNNKPNF